MSDVSSHPVSPGQVLARRVKEVRERRGWTQQRLAEASGLARETINRIEHKSGKRASTARLDEIFALARALDVAPVHLLVPLEDDAMIQLGPDPYPSPILRAWIRGLRPLREGDRALLEFLAETPDSERKALARAHLTRDCGFWHTAIVKDVV